MSFGSIPTRSANTKSSYYRSLHVAFTLLKTYILRSTPYMKTALDQEVPSDLNNDKTAHNNMNYKCTDREKSEGQSPSYEYIHITTPYHSGSFLARAWTFRQTESTSLVLLHSWRTGCLSCLFQAPNIFVSNTSPRPCTKNIGLKITTCIWSHSRTILSALLLLHMKTHCTDLLYRAVSSTVCRRSHVFQSGGKRITPYL